MPKNPNDFFWRVFEDLASCSPQFPCLVEMLKWKRLEEEKSIWGKIPL